MRTNQALKKARRILRKNGWHRYTLIPEHGDPSLEDVSEVPGVVDLETGEIMSLRMAKFRRPDAPWMKVPSKTLMELLRAMYAATAEASRAR